MIVTDIIASCVPKIIDTILFTETHVHCRKHFHVSFLIFFKPDSSVWMIQKFLLHNRLHFKTHPHSDWQIVQYMLYKSKVTMNSVWFSGRASVPQLTLRFFNNYPYTMINLRINIWYMFCKHCSPMMTPTQGK